MRVINLDFYENKTSIYLGNEIDRLSTKINFIMDKDFKANNAKFYYELILTDGKFIQKIPIKVNKQLSNNIVSYIIPNDIKAIFPSKGQLQLKVKINSLDVYPGVFYSYKYNYIIGNNLDLNIE